MWFLFTLRVSFDMQTLDETGVGERCLRGRGDFDLVRRDLRYLSRDRDRDEPLPLLLLLLLPLLEDLERDLDLLFVFPGAFREEGDGFRGALGLESVGFFLGVRLLESLLLELPLELERLDPEELERDPELERLELLLPDEELEGVRKEYL